MANKYILKESELSALISEVIQEEISSLDEGFVRGLANLAFNAGMAALNPGYAASKGFGAVDDFIKGGGRTGSIGDKFRSNDGSSSSGGRKMSRGSRRAQKQSERLSIGRNVGYEYGKPEVVPSWGNRLKLDSKREITVPEEVLDDKGKCIEWGSRTGDWGSFGKHYHDESDRMWQRVFRDKENALLRICRNDQSKLEELKRKYKRILVKWLEERDKAYEIYIKGHNRM